MTKASRPIKFLLDNEKAAELRTQLLLWRLDGFDGFDGFPRDVPEELKFANGRFVEKYFPLYMVANDGRENIIQHAKKTHELEILEEWSTNEAEITSILKNLTPKIKGGRFATKDVTDIFNSTRNKQDQWKTNSIGLVISRLGFHKARTVEGLRGYIWDQNVLNHNLRRYGLETREEGVLGEPSNPSKPSSELSVLDRVGVWLATQTRPFPVAKLAADLGLTPEQARDLIRQLGEWDIDDRDVVSRRPDFMEEASS